MKYGKDVLHCRCKFVLIERTPQRQPGGGHQCAGVQRLGCSGDLHRTDIISGLACKGEHHAACFGLRNPHLVNRILGMSGLYDIRSVTGGWSDDLVYQCNPADFVRNEWDSTRLDAFRRQDIILAIGRDDPNHHDNAEFSATLWQKGIGNALRVWDGWSHDWPFWEKMLRMYVGGHD